MLAETVDAVIGIDTHRDSHEAEIADSTGQPIAAMRIGNDSAGFTQLLAAIAEVVPGPRVAVCVAATRSCGIGLAGALAAAGMLVIEGGGLAASAAAARASPTRSTRTWRCWPRCAWTPPVFRCRALMATGRRCASCWLPGRKSGRPAPRRLPGC